MLYGLYSVWCCIAVCSYSAVWPCMGLYGCMEPGGRRDKVSLMYGAKYSEIQRNTAEIHTADHTVPALPHGACRGGDAHPEGGQAAVDAALGPGYHSERSTTFSSRVFIHERAIRRCVSVSFGAIHQESHTAHHTAVWRHTCATHCPASLPAPYSHTAPYNTV